MAETSNRKTFQEMYINVGWQTVKNDPNKNGMTYASHTLPSLHLFTPHQLTAHPIPTACRLPIHSSSSTQSTKFHITVSITHHMHKYNNSKSLFSHNCNGSIITKQQSKITKTPKQCFSQTTNCRTCHYPTHPDYHMQPPAPFTPIST